jgi:CHASE3 domain sensor protein
LKRLTLRRRIQIGAAILLLIAAAATLTFVVREYRRDRDSSLLLYTNSIKKHDIVDAARNSLSALMDAELRAENYILTGETVYSEAYAEDTRDWEDEEGVLVLVARNDPATPIIQDFSKAGKRTMGELAEVLSLYEKSGGNAAMERIRKSSAIVYLNQARDSAAKIVEADGGRYDGTSEINRRAISPMHRLTQGAAVLFSLTVIAALLLILETLREQRRAQERRAGLRENAALH